LFSLIVIRSGILVPTAEPSTFSISIPQKNKSQNSSKKLSERLSGNDGCMFIGSMHGVADSCSLNGGFRLDVANTRLSEFSVPLLPITRVQESISNRGLANEVNGSPFLCPRWKLLKTEEANGLPKLDQGRTVPNQPPF
jgi:hypothetical protein